MYSGVNKNLPNLCKYIPKELLQINTKMSLFFLTT